VVRFLTCCLSSLRCSAGATSVQGLRVSMRNLQELQPSTCKTIFSQDRRVFTLELPTGMLELINVAHVRPPRCQWHDQPNISRRLRSFSAVLSSYRSSLPVQKQLPSSSSTQLLETASDCRYHRFKQGEGCAVCEQTGCSFPSAVSTRSANHLLD
jgi:hypothetical protein